MCCFREEDFKTFKHVFIPVFFFQVYFKRNYPEITHNGHVVMNASNGQPSALTIFETAL